MPATAFGEPHILFGSKPPTITMYDKTGASLGSAYTNPDLAEATLEVVFDAQNYTNVSGDICARRTRGEYLRATFQVVPNGSTLADAIEAATVPGEGWSFTVSGMHIIRAGSFTDSLNVSSPTTDKPWFIESGSIRGSVQDPAGITFTAVRFPSIASNTPVNEATP